MDLTGQIVIQAFNALVNAALLVAIVRATRSIARMEFKVEMMWKIFSKSIGIPDTND